MSNSHLYMESGSRRDRTKGIPALTQRPSPASSTIRRLRMGEGLRSNVLMNSPVYRSHCKYLFTGIVQGPHSSCQVCADHHTTVTTLIPICALCKIQSCGNSSINQTLTQLGRMLMPVLLMLTRWLKSPAIWQIVCFIELNCPCRSKKTRGK